MMKYPLDFESSTLATPGILAKWKTRSADFETEVAVPKEFAGSGAALSPEDLFNQALTNCFVGTFQVYAANSKLDFESLQVDAKLVMDLDENKKPVMKEFYLTAKIQGPSNPDKALLLARKASEAGFILNSVKTKCHFDFKIV